MSDLDLDAIEARANAATSGPWKAARRGGIHPTVFADDDGAVASVAVARRRGPERTTADVRFIAHARTDIPALIARVREQEQEIARLRQDKAMLDEVYAAYKSGLVQGSGHGYVDVMLRIDHERSARA